MRITLLLILTLLALLACGDSGPMTAGDAGLGDGSASLDAGFDPMSPPVDGEGDACRFSIECGPRQICVDDACIREERVPAAELSHGEPRLLIDAEVRASALYSAAPRDWTEFFTLPDEKGAARLLAWTFPGPGGPTLVALYSNHLRCQVLIVGDTVRVVHHPEVGCHVAALAENGELLTASNHLDLAYYESDGSVRWTARVSDDDKLALFRETGSTQVVGSSNAAIVANGRGLVSFTYLPTDEDPLDPFPLTSEFNSRIGFLDVDLATGSYEVLRFEGLPWTPGAFGWLARTGDTVGAIMLDRPELEATPLEGPIPIEWMELDSGARRVLFDGNGFRARYAQPTTSSFDLVVEDLLECRLARSSHEGVRETFPWRACTGRFDPQADQNDYGGEPNDLLSTPAFLGHEDLRMLYTSQNSVDGPNITVETLRTEPDWQTDRIELPDLRHQLLAFWAVARFGKTGEIVSQGRSDGDLSWMELALRRIR
jgi:hypothetical protein